MPANSSKIFHFDKRIIRASEDALETTQKAREEVRKILFHNQKKVLEAFIEENVSEYHFAGTTGYGFHDPGREALDKLYARIFKTESAIVRHNFVSGTHAISTILRSNLFPGNEILCATGEPYDTIKPVLGLDKNWEGGLHQWNVSVRVVPLNEDNFPDNEAIINAIGEKTRMVFLQRSCGYTWRPSFSTGVLKEINDLIKSVKNDVIVLVDNCYGEMVEIIEPTEVGADMIAGSLIKNMGGGIAPCGGYIAGKDLIVRRAASALTCAGVGKEEGATIGINRLLFQGTFFAPKIIAEALQGAIWASCLLEQFGFETKPRWDESRTDIIQGIKLGSIKKMEVFCRGIQRACPVDHRATPEAATLPGYRDPIIMAGGTFIQGSSIELSCDGPLREPYAVYLQGGVSFEHIQLGVMNALQEMMNEGMV